VYSIGGGRRNETVYIFPLFFVEDPFGIVFDGIFPEGKNLMGGMTTPVRLEKPWMICSLCQLQLSRKTGKRGEDGRGFLNGDPYFL